MIMNGQMMNYERYLDSLKRTPEVDVPRVRLNLQALIKMARDKGIRLSQLTREEIQPLIKPID